MCHTMRGKIVVFLEQFCRGNRRLKTQKCVWSMESIVRLSRLWAVQGGENTPGPGNYNVHLFNSHTFIKNYRNGSAIVTGPFFGFGNCIFLKGHALTKCLWKTTEEVLCDKILHTCNSLSCCNKQHRLKKQTFILCSGGWKSKVKVSAGWFLVRPLSWACRSPSSSCTWHILPSVCVCHGLSFLQGHSLY